MKYLKDIKTLEEQKKSYRAWAIKLHPDKGGSDAEMKILNAEYEKVFERVKEIHTDKNGQQYHKENKEAPGDFLRIINELLKLNGVHIEIIGCFLWVTGNTKPYKDILKSLGLKWHRKKGCWFLSPENYHRRGNREYDLTEIRMMYGVEFDKEVRRKELKNI